MGIAGCQRPPHICRRIHAPLLPSLPLYSPPLPLPLCRYTFPQFCCVLILTFGAACATFAEALVGDTATAAKRAGQAAATACSNCEDGGARNLGQLTAGAVPSAAAAAVTSLASAASSSSSSSSSYMWTWALGLLILALVLVLQTLLGNYQNWAAARYGKAPYEGMFFMHSMALPAFLLGAPSLLQKAHDWSQTPATGEVLKGYLEAAAASAAAAAAGAAGIGAGAVVQPTLGQSLLAWVAWPVSSLPIMWSYVLLNVVSQFICIIGVYNLTSMADPLTVNVTLTVRKFLSLMLSIWGFNNTFTTVHWLGAIMVFGGAAWYSQLPQPLTPEQAMKKELVPTQGPILGLNSTSSSSAGSTSKVAPVGGAVGAFAKQDSLSHSLQGSGTSSSSNSTGILAAPLGSASPRLVPHSAAAGAPAAFSLGSIGGGSTASKAQQQQQMLQHGRSATAPVTFESDNSPR